MKAYRALIAAIVMAILSLGIVNISSASGHPPYQLGHAKACKADYFKSTHVHMVRGKRVRFVACVYRAPVTATTKGGDPPTAISITPSESPAIVGDIITYSMVVADVLTSTLGQVYMTDNGVKLTGCTGPTPTSQGSLAYSCTETYTSSDTGSHLIAGIFLGDATYGQSAGQIVEPVDLTAPTTTTTIPLSGVLSTTTTTTSPPPTTTTTQAPTIALGVSLDPLYTQSPNNPLVVTYNYSASATETLNGLTSPDPSLPPGTLYLYNDGSRVCSASVGDSVSSARCVVTYAATGNNTVTIEYVSGANIAQQTYTEDITAFATTTRASFVVVNSMTVMRVVGLETESQVRLSVSVTDQNGNPVSPAAGAVSFDVNGLGVFTTTANGQTECDLTVFNPAPGVRAVAAFSSSNCTDPPGSVCSFAYGCMVGSISFLSSVGGTGDFAGSATDTRSEGGAVVTLPAGS